LKKKFPLEWEKRFEGDVWRERDKEGSNKG
jgi:hypothetical protein